MIPKIFTLQRSSPHSSQLGRLSGYISKLVAFALLLSSGLVVSNTVHAQTYNYDNITISSTVDGANSSVTTYDGTLDPNGTNDAFDGAVIGGSGAIFSQSTGSILITAASSNLGTSSTRPFTASQLQYRVYATNATVLPSYSVLNLDKTSSSTTYDPTTFAASNQSIDVLNQPTVLGAGNYTVDIVYVSTYQVAGRGGPTPKTITDPSTTNNYGFRATFQVSAPAVTPNGGTTTWISRSSTDWTDRNNWSNGVPTAGSNAILPGHDSNAGDPFTVSPVLVARAAPYDVRTLTLQNASNPVRATMRVNAGATLAVYGDLNQAGGGLDVATTNNAGNADPINNSTIVFAGVDQVIRGTLNASDVRIAGSGTKSVINALNASNTLTMDPADATVGVLLQTATESTNGANVTPVVTFDTSLNTTVNLLSTGTLIGETNLSYVRGVLKSDRTLTNGNLETFGNVGLDIRPNRDLSNTTTVTRVVGAALNGPTGSSAKPVKRQYIVAGDVNTNTIVDLVFHYLDSPDELNGIPEGNLLMFRSQNGQAPYRALGSTVNTTDNTVTRIGLPGGIYTVTLGDKDNPLPVSLAAFAAARSGANTLVTWTTATEENNKGFNVQVSTNGVSYRTLGFVTSQSPNSSTALNYKYTDTETGKTGTRYYRLEQVDQNGKLNYSPVRAVNFDGAASSGALVAYPNPFTDTIGLTVDGAAITEGTAYVKLVDMTGRTVRDQKVSFTGASIALDDLNGLRSGLYLAKVTLPDGTTQTVRIQKQ